MSQYKNLEHPTSKLIDRYIAKFNKDYRRTESSITSVIRAFPANNKLEDVLPKVCVINELYKTRILDVRKIARHIEKMSNKKFLQEKILAGNPAAVGLIANGHNIQKASNKKENCCYSFATKYCNWHNPSHYSIYDRYVDEILWAYRLRDKFYIFKRKDLKNFEEFSRTIVEFQKYFKLTKYSLKDLDKFFWLYGKEKFPPKYKN